MLTFELNLHTNSPKRIVLVWETTLFLSLDLSIDVFPLTVGISRPSCLTSMPSS